MPFRETYSTRSCNISEHESYGWVWPVLNHDRAELIVVTGRCSGAREDLAREDLAREDLAREDLAREDLAREDFDEAVGIVP